MPFNYKKYKDAQNTPLPAREQSPIKAYFLAGLSSGYEYKKNPKGANIFEKAINAIDDGVTGGLGQSIWNTYAPVYKSEFKKYKDHVKKLHKK